MLHDGHRLAKLGENADRLPQLMLPNADGAEGWRGAGNQSGVDGGHEDTEGAAVIFDFAVARLEREDADLGAFGQSIWKAVATVDVFYFDEIADATGLLFDHARKDTEWVRQRRGKVHSRSKGRLKQRVCGRVLFPLYIPAGEWTVA